MTAELDNIAGSRKAAGSSLARPSHGLAGATRGIHCHAGDEPAPRTRDRRISAPVSAWPTP